jgi:hypothetical protein
MIGGTGRQGEGKMDRLQGVLRSGIFAGFVILVAALPLFSARPLTKDEINLLLVGGAAPQKIMTLVAERGVDFRMTPAIGKEFQKNGATPELIEEIQKISDQLYSAAPPSNPPRTENPAPPARSALPQRSSAPSAPPSPAQERVNHVLASLASHPAPAGPPVLTASSGSAAAPAKEAPPVKLTDPSPAEIQNIIRTFAAKETLFKAARNNYTYHQINRVETIDADGHVNGTWEQDWDILYDNNGHRIERVTYAPVGDLKDVLMTEQDIYQMRHTQPFVVTTGTLPEYDVKYLGHVPLDKLTAYVFRVKPKAIKKHHEYFDGVVYVDDHDLQIVKTEGRQVPQIIRGDHQNLFPEFSTWRQQIDGKFWFPVFTMADDTLYFASGPVHIKEIIRYTDYKQFKSTSKIKMIGVAGPNQTSQPPATPKPHHHQ